MRWVDTHSNFYFGVWRSHPESWTSFNTISTEHELSATKIKTILISRAHTGDPGGGFVAQLGSRTENATFALQVSKSCSLVRFFRQGIHHFLHIRFNLQEGPGSGRTFFDFFSITYIVYAQNQDFRCHDSAFALLATAGLVIFPVANYRNSILAEYRTWDFSATTRVEQAR